ncbi:fatty acid desaturase family protein [Chryseobacterium potabilaquae]|uniref:NADPH-dependent stearoyl-CoA 9-desaturase n=1 Tax=Chryseobacterium potabilaquae TaxID=2675057 RepID=A0A6N4X7G2_9FLAO|nr:acyl-CoA desaturase [Chryseobacterium potabilaquae]CAA7196936.1 NADPH-dependent stearoyl-CoA 9-desaturase [Chryseobacterium potabilaquae]
MSQKIKFPSTSGSDFYTTIRSRVDQFFIQNQLSQHANVHMWGKTIFFLAGFIGIYLVIITSLFPAGMLLLLAAVLGMFSAFVGFNVCHDAIHGALSGNKKVNKAFGFIFNLIGANPYVWNITHNVVHHSYTNIPGHDEDIEVAPGLIRIAREGTVNSIQKYQHWYAFPLYSLASLSWVFRKDYVKFFKKKIGARQSKHPKVEYFNLFFYKALYYFLFIILPLLVMDISWWQFLIGFMFLHIAEGLTMGLVFQLAHVVEDTTFPIPNENGRMEEAWAEHQMRTTANFATDNKFAAFFLGGLNRQIEHHLFPKVCHIHYGEISIIVKKTAIEFNLPYIENKSFLSALHSHFLTLKKFSKEANC